MGPALPVLQMLLKTSQYSPKFNLCKSKFLIDSFGMDSVQYLARRLMMLFVALFGLIGLLFAGMITYRPSPSESTEVLAAAAPDEWHPRDILEEWESAGPEVRRGYQLISESALRMGPGAEDPGDRFAGNNLSCTNCHLKGGTQSGSASWIGVADRFPQFGGRSNRIGTLQDRINGCMERSMNGREIPVESEFMKAIVAYMEWLGEGLPAGKEKEYKGYAPIRIPKRAADLQAGREVYARDCAVCHGAEGQGVPDAVGGYIYPPLWGADSFNDGAGMHRVITAAEFIRSNMPYGIATRDTPKLSHEEAFDVAGYMNSFERPHKGGAEADYPDRKLKPVSTPYGPWADEYSAREHKYGPFPPIIAFYKARYNIDKIQ